MLRVVESLRQDVFCCSTIRSVLATQFNINNSRNSDYFQICNVGWIRLQGGGGGGGQQQQSRQSQDLVDPNDIQFQTVAAVKKMMHHDVCLNDEQAEKALRVRRRIKPSVWTRYFFERRKLQAIYCLSRKQLRMLVGLALTRHGRAGENLIGLLERRLDVVLWRSLLCPTIYAARNAVLYKQVRLNGQLAIRPGYLVWPGDVIQLGYDRAPAMLKFLSHKDKVDNSIGLNAQVKEGHPNQIQNNALITRMMMTLKQEQERRQPPLRKKSNKAEDSQKS